MKVFIPDNSLHPDAVELFKQNNFEFLNQDNSFDADILVAPVTHEVSHENIEMFPNLKFILRTGVGTDNIDELGCEARGIKIFNAPGSNSNAVAEYVIGIMIYLTRNIELQFEELRMGRWRNPDFTGREIVNMKIGLLGYGHIGKIIGTKLIGLGSKQIIMYDKHDNDGPLPEEITKVSLQELIEQSDVISVQIPLTPETKDTFAADQFKSMKDDSFLINVGRGGIVNENDLIDAMRSGEIYGAALDVFESEPNIKKALIEDTRIICTPHIAGYTQHSIREMSMIPVKRLLEEISHQ